MRSHPPKHQIQHHRFKEYIRCHLYLHQGKSRFTTVTMYWIIQSRHVLTYLFKGRWSPRTNRPFWVLKRKPSLWGTLAFPIFLPKDQRWDPNPRALRWVRSQEVGKIEVKPPPWSFFTAGEHLRLSTSAKRGFQNWEIIHFKRFHVQLWGCNSFWGFLFKDCKIVIPKLVPAISLFVVLQVFEYK